MAKIIGKMFKGPREDGFDGRGEQLVTAAFIGDIALLYSAMEEGAEPHYNDSLPLRVAAERGYHEIVNILLPLSNIEKAMSHPNMCEHPEELGRALLADIQRRMLLQSDKENFPNSKNITLHI